jgi:hypothetical protein
MSILGPLWAGITYDRVMHGAPYWMGAVIYAFAALVIQFQKKGRTEVKQGLESK